MKLKCILVLLVKGQSSKTPLTVLEHELPILRLLHGGEDEEMQATVIEVTDAVPAAPFVEIHDADTEYARLKNFYIGNANLPNPTRAIYPTLKIFEESLVAHVDEADSADLLDLLAQAKELGIKVDKRWNLVRLQAEIDKKLAE